MNTSPVVRAWEDKERLSFLLDAARSFGCTLEPDQIYAALLRLLQETFGADGVIVSSYDEGSGMIRCEYAFADGSFPDPAALPPVRLIPDGTGMQSRVIVRGQAEVFDIAEKVTEPNTSYIEIGSTGEAVPLKEKPQARTAMMAPMMLDGKVTGVVQAMSNAPQAFSPPDLEVFESMVLLMSPAWHHARQFKQSQEQRSLIDGIMTASPDVIYVFDLRTQRITFTNYGYERNLGYRAGELSGTASVSIMHPDDLARLPQLLSRFDDAADAQIFETEYRIQSKSGEWRWYLNRDTVFERDSEGKAVKIVGFGHDITHRKKQDEAVREANEQYRVLAEAGPFIVFSSGTDNVINFVNHRWYEYFGADADPRDAQVRYDRMHPDDRDAARRLYEHALADGQPFQCEYRLLRHDGVYRWHVCRTVPIRNEAGVPLRWIGILFDIQDQKEIEAELERRVQERTEQMSDAVKELEGFTYTVSHDLRGPLRAISAASMMLREDFGDKLPEEAQEHLQRQNDAAKKMALLIDDLLKLSRLNRQEMKPGRFDLSAMAEDVVQELHPRLEVKIQPGMSAYGDTRLLRFVLLNLIENAVKFSPDGGEIEVGSDNGAYFVADHGIGIRKESAERIFLPFERDVRPDEFPGSGIGLANVKRIVKRHGGTVWVESEPGQGSKFWFTLPEPADQG